MQGIVKVDTVLVNPDGIIQKEIRVDYEPGQETDTCLQILTALRANGGIVRRVDDGEIEYTPILMTRVHHIDVKLGRVQVAGGSIVHP
jgi:hypothetical protein